MPNTDRIGIVTLYITIYTSFPKLRGTESDRICGKSDWYADRDRAD